MPKVSAAHQEQVRRRIVDAALRVFSAHGYHRSTVADVVAVSGLSVGAIYTYFPSKEALFVETCDLASAQGVEELGSRLVGVEHTAERMAVACALFVETIDSFDGDPGQVSLVAAWSEAEADPALRGMLARRRQRLVTAGRLILVDGVARGELPVWLDVEAVAWAISAMLDGLILQRVEAGPEFRPADLHARTSAILAVLLAANASATGDGLPAAAAASA